MNQSFQHRLSQELAKDQLYRNEKHSFVLQQDEDDYVASAAGQERNDARGEHNSFSPTMSTAADDLDFCFSPFDKV